MPKVSNKHFKIFAPDFYAKNALQICSRQHPINKKLDIQDFSGGIISIDPNSGLGVAYTSDGIFIPESLTVDSTTNIEIPSSTMTETDVNDAEYMDCNAVFCGIGMIGHFGHFLFDGLSRAYPALDNKYRDCKFIFTEYLSTMPSFAIDLLEMLGVAPENIIILKKTTRFKTLYVPQQSFLLYNPNTPIPYEPTYSAIADTAMPGTHEKVYVSRAKMGGGGEYMAKNKFRKFSLITDII